MKISSLFFLLVSFTLPAAAAEFKDLSRPLPDLFRQSAAEPPAATPLKLAPAAPDTTRSTALYWTHLYRETFLQGAATFEYKNQQYAIKALFTKGAYDMDKGTYATEAWLYILDVSNIDEKAPIKVRIDFRAEGETLVETGYGNSFKVKIGGGSLSILSKGVFADKKIFSATLDQFLNLWAENAEKYKRTVHGKTIYLVPQLIMAADSSTLIGFVASQGSPLSATTKRPLDFIALCLSKNDLPCRPLRYSIPLGLKFVYLGIPNSTTDKEYFYWEIAEMVNDDLYDALDDEARELALFAEAR